jgi:hypothetical protein
MRKLVSEFRPHGPRHYIGTTPKGQWDGVFGDLRRAYTGHLRRIAKVKLRFKVPYKNLKTKT